MRGGGTVLDPTANSVWEGIVDRVVILHILQPIVILMILAGPWEVVEGGDTSVINATRKGVVELGKGSFDVRLGKHGAHRNVLREWRNTDNLKC